MVSQLSWAGIFFNISSLDMPLNKFKYLKKER